jgi:dTMP kinase
MSEQAGRFIVIEGPSGIGKTTITAMLRDELAKRGLPAVATREPSDSALGKLARQGTEEYRGLVLACLVAADRYYHIERDIRPALRAGYVVVCDRYVPTSLVLQQMDGVTPDFVEYLNQYAERPDLTIILTGQPRQSGQRAHERGVYSRFHRTGPSARAVEDQLYRDVAQNLVTARWPVLHYEVASQSRETITAVALHAVLPLLGHSSG